MENNIETLRHEEESTAPQTRPLQDESFPDTLAPTAPEVRSEEGPGLDELTGPLRAALLAADPDVVDDSAGILENAELAAAVEAVKEKARTAASAEDLRGMLDAIASQFHLEYARLVGFGTPDLAVELKRNPVYTVNLKQAGVKTSQLPPSKASTVKYKTGSVGGSDVGTGMIADPLGPDHIAGSSPSGAALRDVMMKLPTDPKRPNNQKYIKGHLLNDQLGGKGIAKNLFPITAQANRAHESAIESAAKTLVNNKRQWVKYQVDVAYNDKISSKGTVDAQLDATLTEYTSDGTLADSAYKTAKIKSVYGGSPDPEESDVEASDDALTSGAVSPELPARVRDNANPDDICEEFQGLVNGFVASMEPFSGARNHKNTMMAYLFTEYFNKESWKNFYLEKLDTVPRQGVANQVAPLLDEINDHLTKVGDLITEAYLNGELEERGSFNHKLAAALKS